MKRKNIVYTGLLATALLSGGCAATSDVETLQRQISMVNQKLENMKSTTMDQLQKRQANASGHLDQLEQDITQLRAQIEESYYLNQRLREQNKELEAAISSVAEQESVKREEALQALITEQKAKEAKIQQMLKRQQENVNAIQAARVRELERKAKEAELEAKLAQQRKAAAKAAKTTEQSKSIYATQKKVKKARQIEKSSAPVTAQQPAAPTKQAKNIIPAATVAPPPPAASTPDSPAPAVNSIVDARMENGKRLLQQKKYRQAFSAFEEIAQDNTAKERVAARFMMGECQFALKQYDLAVVHYQAVFAKSPGSATAPQALMRQAEAFEKMADKETAKLVYAKIIKHYGSSPQAVEAKERLATL